MKLRFVAQIDTGKLKIYEENDMENPAYTMNVETEDRQHFKMKVKNKENKLISEILYQEEVKRKFMMVSDYTINNLETGEQTKVKAKIGEKLFIGENKEMYLERSIRDRKMRLYKNDKLIMNLKCKTILRNWLRGDYTAEILDESYTSLCVCVIIIVLNVIFDEHNCTSLTV
ncbi:MAG: hypothetical protein IJI84_02645 [Clostridia bacterium]|nr:hypothetical protein [Clostridia bacterium]